jgi:hypothetical protein
MANLHFRGMHSDKLKKLFAVLGQDNDGEFNNTRQKVTDILAEQKRTGFCRLAFFRVFTRVVQLARGPREPTRGGDSAPARSLSSQAVRNERHQQSARPSVAPRYAPEQCQIMRPLAIRGGISPDPDRR